MAGKARPVARGTFDLLALQQKKQREDTSNLRRGGMTPTHPVYLPTFPVDAVEGQIAFAKPDVMGQVLSSAGLTNGLRLFCGVLYQPDGPLLSGETVGVDFSHWPGANFTWIAVRIHAIQGLKAVGYDRTQPWESDPFAGGIGSYLSGSRTWNQFTSFLALTNTSGDVVTWTHPVAVGVEQFAWDLATVGHIGYAFQDFGTGAPVTDTAAATFGSVSTEKVGAIQFNFSTGPVTVGATLGSASLTPGLSAKRLTCVLSADQPAGYAAMVVCAAKTTAGALDSDALNRPAILLDRSGHARDTVVPYQYLDGQWVRIANGPYI